MCPFVQESFSFRRLRIIVQYLMSFFLSICAICSIYFIEYKLNVDINGDPIRTELIRTELIRTLKLRLFDRNKPKTERGIMG